MAISRVKVASVSVGKSLGEDLDFSKDIDAIVTSSQNFIEKYSMLRVAGNVYECPSSKDFWEVKNGKIMRLTKANEVDNGETIVAANKDNPEFTLNQILADLEF